MAPATEYVPEGDSTSPSAVITTAYHTTIDAPASHVFRLVTHPSTWPQWNTFVPACSADTIEVGTRTTFHMTMDPAKPKSTQQMGVKVQAVEETTQGYRVRWDLDPPLPAFFLRAERTQEFLKVDETRCEYQTVEHMYGPLAYTIKYVRPTHATLKARFADWCNNLRDYAESTWKQGESDGA